MESTLKNSKKRLMTVIYTALICAAAVPAMAESGKDNNKEAPMEAADSRVTVLAQAGDDEEVLEEVVILGTRSKEPRSVTDSTVPIDIFSNADISAMGNTWDLTDSLKTLVPSYTAAPATGDGSAFIRATSLRAMAPDQTLVLVNGKRRHRSALVHFFAPVSGNGSHAVDVGLIPGIAVKNVEVLRDGAAAQYGSDAIAGVINFQMKDAAEGGSVQITYGENYDDPTSISIAANIGFPLGENGFINLSAERADNEAIIRSIQRPDAQAAIDAGIIGIGADAPFGEAPLAQTWGRPETDATRFFINAGVDLDDDKELYFQSNIAESWGRYRFFFRNNKVPFSDPPEGLHSVFRHLIDNAGYDGVNGALIQTGFTPYLDGEQDDISLVGGLRGEFANGTYYDFSVAYGKNEIDYVLNNAVNPSLGLGADGEPFLRLFDVGGFDQEETMFNADFSKVLSSSLHLGYGAEWREESYTMYVGEPDTLVGVGTALSGFSSPGAGDAGKFSRDNYALYVDLEQDISDELMLQYALRYEDFSDFGDTINGKFAARYNVTETTTLRGAISTGFHAPTPGQANVRSTITTFDGVTGDLTLEGLIPATHPDAVAVGGVALTEEQSLNFSIGFTSDLTDNTTLTVDAYQIDVDDRIYRTGDILKPDGTSISFYTNALDIEHKGVDVVLTSDIDWSGEVSTNVSFAFSYNKVDITGQKSVQTPTGPVTPVSAGNVEDIENNFPNERFVLTTNTRFSDRWNLMARANYYGDHFDERGRIGAASNPSAEIDSVIYIDLELSYDVNDQVRLALGGSNVFDEFVDTIGPPNANRLSVGLPYPRRTPANYEGGSWYLRLNYNF
jgi:iron complex outermembrane receptor protein